MFTGRVVGPTDPQWLDTDRGYALAWSANKAATCPGCGTRDDEWDVDEDAYISDHVTCPGCQRLQEHAESNLERRGDKVLPGQHPHLVPREVYEARAARRRQARATDN